MSRRYDRHKEVEDPIRELAVAVVSQSLIDARRGDPGALQFLTAEENEFFDALNLPYNSQNIDRIVKQGIRAGLRIRTQRIKTLLKRSI